MKIIPYFLLFWAFLSGCATQPVSMASLPGEIRYTQADAVPVRLDAASITRTESPWGLFGEETRFKFITGSVWSRVFVGFKEEQPTLSIVSSRLSEDISGGGFTIRYTYTAQAILHYDGHDIPISATGTRAAAMAMGSAMRQSVELAAVDAAHQVRTILEANKK